jgi:GT2 family glycosyltransferase
VGSPGNGGPRVAIVVLTWNGRDDTLGCLASLRAVEHEPLDVIVVDNGSGDGTAEAVREGFPEVELVRSEENLGFAGGNDLGIRHALERGADHVLVLNNDVEVEPGFVGALVEEAGRRPDAGALCSKILYFEPRDRIWFAGASFDPRRGYGRHVRYREPDDPAETEPSETDRACGAAMLVPRAVLEQVGDFDPELFIYAEDTEWSLRARKAGKRHWVVPRSRIYHKVSVTSGGENMPTPLYYGTRNTLVVCERHAPLGRFGTWRRRALVVAANLAQALTSPKRAESLRAVRDGWADFRRGRLGKRGA